MLRLLRRIVLVVVASSCVANAAGAKEVGLIFATANPANANLNVEFMHPWATRINEEGKGVIHIDIRDGMTIADLANAYDRVMNNVVQIAFGIHAGAPGVFRRTAVAGLPSFTEPSDVASVALWRLSRSPLLRAEYANVVPLVMLVFPPGGLHFRSSIKSADDLKGLKIIAAAKPVAQLVESFGAAPVTLLPSDYYEALQRGTVDGVASAWTTFEPFKLYEVTHYHIETPGGRGTAMIFMKRTQFLALPEAARRILDKYAGEKPSRDFGRFEDGVQNHWRESVGHMKGEEVVDLKPGEARAWRSHVAQIDRAWVRANPDGAEVFARYRAILSELQRAQ